MLNKAKAKEPPRLHFAILLVSHGLRPFEEGKGPVKWDMITMAKIQTWCKKKKDANPGWHPHLFEVPLDMYIDTTPAKKRWWLLPPLVVAPPILAVALPVLAVAPPILAVAPPVLAVAPPVLVVAPPVLAVALPVLAVTPPAPEGPFD